MEYLYSLQPYLPTKARMHYNTRNMEMTNT